MLILICAEIAYVKDMVILITKALIVTTLLLMVNVHMLLLETKISEASMLSRYDFHSV